MSDFVFTTKNTDGADVYASDGTAAGTTDLELSRSSYVPGIDGPDFTNFDGKTLFVGTDGVQTMTTDAYGAVYSTNGTVAGTVASDIVGLGGRDYPNALATLDTLVLVSGPTIESPPGIWASSDGSNFTQIESGVGFRSLTINNGVAFFEGLNQSVGPAGLWRTDGTASGTFEINPPGVTLDPQGIAAAGTGLTAFINQGPGGDGTLWVTNGTASGTSEIVNAALGSDLNTQLGMVTSGGKAFFAAIDTAGDYSVWATDGTSAGTVQVFDGGVATADIRPITSLAAFGDKVVITNGYGIYVSNGTAGGTVNLPLPIVGGDNAVPASYVVAGSNLFMAAPSDNGVSYPLYVSDGTVAGTVAIKVPGLVSINGPLQAAGNDVVFEGTDMSGQQALFESNGSMAGSEELTLPAGVTVEASTVIAALAVNTTPPAALTATLPNPLYTGTETVSGTGGVTGLQVERITTGTYNTPGSTGWVKATVQANGDWSAQVSFDKAGQLAHVYAENGGSSTVVDLVNGTPTTAPVNPPPPPPAPSLIGFLPSPLHTGVETVSGYGGLRGLRVERITEGTYNTPGSTGWVTASVAGNGDWTAELTFDKPGQLAHVYAQNGGTGAVIDLVNGTPMAAAASSVAGSVASDMTAKAGVPASAQVPQLSSGPISGGSTISVLSTHAAALVVPDHSQVVAHSG